MWLGLLAARCGRHAYFRKARRRQQADSAREHDISGIEKSMLAKAFRDLAISPHALKITAIVK
jgi:hypothetical protein